MGESEESNWLGSLILGAVVWMVFSFIFTTISYFGKPLYVSNNYNNKATYWDHFNMTFANPLYYEYVTDVKDPSKNYLKKSNNIFLGVFMGIPIFLGVFTFLKSSKIL